MLIHHICCDFPGCTAREQVPDLASPIPKGWLKRFITDIYCTQGGGSTYNGEELSHYCPTHQRQIQPPIVRAVLDKLEDPNRPRPVDV